MKLTSLWKGQISYCESLHLQEELKTACLKQGRDFALGFECPGVVTLGLRGSQKDLLVDRKEFSKKNIEIISIKRGGQATLHSLGQLVIYPVVDIKKNKMRVRDFIVFIEKITQKTLLELGIATHKEEGQAGLFTKKGKIAFFGLHVTQGVSQHGLAVNVQNDLQLFSLIRSCGTSHRPHDSVASYVKNITVQEVFDLWIQKTLDLSKENCCERGETQSPKL